MTFKSIGLVVAVTLATFAGLNNDTYAFKIDEGVEGYWYEAGLNARRGWGLQYLKTGPEQGVLFVAGFVYDNLNEPIWVTGDALVWDGQHEVNMSLQLIEGGTFGPDAGNPVVANDHIVGLNIRFNSCNSADFHFSGDIHNFSQNFDPFLELVGGAREGRCVYQREFTACPDGFDAGMGERSCILSGTYTEDLLLTNEITWELDGIVHIGAKAAPGQAVPENGPAITIEAGTRIRGLGGSALVVNRGSKIIAEGQPHAPIVMNGYFSTIEGAQPGDWGGLVINGAAVINGCASTPCEHDGDGLTGAYGGTDDDDDSGILRYVRIQYAGGVIDFQQDEDLPGLSLNAVGRGTVIDHLQIHRSLDDGVKFHGGTANLDYLVITDAQLDAVDWSDGFRGKVQHALIWQRNVSGDWGERGIEGENGDSEFEYNGPNAAPRSMPTLANVTLVGNFGHEAINIRAGSGGRFSNIVIVGYQRGINIDGEATFLAAGTPQNRSGVLVFENVISWTNHDWFSDDDTGSPWLVEDFMAAQKGNTRGVSPGLYTGQGYNYIPPQGPYTWYIRDHALDPEVFDDFFKDSGYAGAFRSSDSAWHYRWAEFLHE